VGNPERVFDLKARVSEGVFEAWDAEKRLEKP
jgi:hypothetical protein